MTDIFEMMDAENAARPRIVRYFRSKGIAGKNTWYWITNPHRTYEIPAHFLRQFRWAVTRGRKGYALPDTWSLDSYLLSWLPDAIADLRAGAHGFPVDRLEELSPAETEAGFEAWMATLTTIENGLRAGARFSDLSSKPDDVAADKAAFDEAWKLMGENFFSLWN